MSNPEIPKWLADKLNNIQCEEHRKKVIQAYYDGEREKQEYKQFYYGLMWKEMNHQTGGDV